MNINDLYVKFPKNRNNNTTDKVKYQFPIDFKPLVVYSSKIPNKLIDKDKYILNREDVDLVTYDDRVQDNTDSDDKLSDNDNDNDSNSNNNEIISNDLIIDDTIIGNINYNLLDDLPESEGITKESSDNYKDEEDDCDNDNDIANSLMYQGSIFARMLSKEADDQSIDIVANNGNIIDSEDNNNNSDLLDEVIVDSNNQVIDISDNITSDNNNLTDNDDDNVIIDILDKATVTDNDNMNLPDNIVRDNVHTDIKSDSNDNYTIDEPIQKHISKIDTKITSNNIEKMTNMLEKLESELEILGFHRSKPTDHQLDSHIDSEGRNETTTDKINDVNSSYNNEVSYIRKRKPYFMRIIEEIKEKENEENQQIEKKIHEIKSTNKSRSVISEINDHMKWHDKIMAKKIINKPIDKVNKKENKPVDKHIIKSNKKTNKLIYESIDDFSMDRYKNKQITKKPFLKRKLKKMKLVHKSKDKEVNSSIDSSLDSIIDNNTISTIAEDSINSNVDIDLTNGVDWVKHILRINSISDEVKHSEIYEQGFAIMMIENGMT